jgi:hypothetical protein
MTGHAGHVIDFGPGANLRNNRLGGGGGGADVCLSIEDDTSHRSDSLTGFCQYRGILEAVLTLGFGMDLPGQEKQRDGNGEQRAENQHEIVEKLAIVTHWVGPLIATVSRQAKL